MPLYKLSALVTVSAHTHVEADTPEEALEEAKSRSCEIGGYGYQPGEFWIIEDADGEPTEIRLEHE